LEYLILDLISTAAILFIISSGLLIIFGVMKIINFAHAGLIVIGGYVSVVVTQQGWSPWAAFPVAFLTGLTAGILIERLIVQKLYNRPLDAILATWGLGIIIVELIIFVFGRQVQFVVPPITGAMDIIGVMYSKYRLFMVPVAISIGVAMWMILHWSKLGLQTRAVIMDERLSLVLGVNSGIVRLVMFAFGAGLAALAGAFITPLASVNPNMGLSWLVPAFMLVLVSGNSFLALAAACLVLGTAQVVVTTYVNPVAGGVTLAMLGAILLRIRPKGFARG